MAVLIFAQTFWKDWKGYILGAMVSAVVITLVASIVWQGIFLQIMGHLAIATVLLPVSLCIAAVTGIWWRWKRAPLPRRMTKWAIAITLFLGLQALLSIPTGLVVSSAYLHHAKTYCDKLVPLLETYYSQQGKYPEPLSQLGDIPKIPRLLQKQTRFYYGNGNSYHFSIDDPQNWDGRWWFDSDIPEWEYVTH